MLRTTKYLCILFPVVLLAACGGGGAGGSTEPVDTPAVPTTNPPTVADDIVVDEPPADTAEFDGTRPSINNLYSESQIAAIEALGLQINEGDSPPNVEGTFLIQPMILQASSVPSDQDGVDGTFNDLEVTFSNQNNDTLTLDLNSASTANSMTEGSGSFISGSNSAFTVFFIAEVTMPDGHVILTTETFSGVVTAAGIQNIQFAGFVLDDRGDPFDNTIPNDTGRLFLDEDGLSIRQGGMPVSLPSISSPLPQSPPADDDTIEPPLTSANPDVLVSQIALYEPLYGEVSFIITPFAGGFFSFRTQFTPDNLIQGGDGDFSLAAIEDGGTVVCSAVNQGESYVCIIDTTLNQVVAVQVAFLGDTGFGNAVVCQEAREDCSADSIAFALDGSPDGPA